MIPPCNGNPVSNGTYGSSVTFFLLLANYKITSKLITFTFILDFQAKRAYGQVGYSIYYKNTNTKYSKHAYSDSALPS